MEFCILLDLQNRGIVLVFCIQVIVFILMKPNAWGFRCEVFGSRRLENAFKNSQYLSIYT